MILSYLFSLKEVVLVYKRLISAPFLKPFAKPTPLPKILNISLAYKELREFGMATIHAGHNVVVGIEISHVDP
jgi:hypothetical protein